MPPNRSSCTPGFHVSAHQNTKIIFNLTPVAGPLSYVHYNTFLVTVIMAANPNLRVPPKSVVSILLLIQRKLNFVGRTQNINNSIEYCHFVGRYLQCTVWFGIETYCINLKTMLTRKVSKVHIRNLLLTHSNLTQT